MNAKDKEEFKEYIDRAIVAGKADASNMANDIIQRMDKEVGKSVEKYVNGHLREIKSHLGSQDTILAGIQKDITQIHTDTDPIVDGKKAATTIGKIILWISGLIIALGGAWQFIKNI